MSLAIILEEEEQLQLDQIKQHMGVKTLDDALRRMIADYRSANKIPNQQTLDALNAPDDDYEVMTMDELRELSQ